MRQENKSKLSKVLTWTANIIKPFLNAPQKPNILSKIIPKPGTNNKIFILIESAILNLKKN